MAAAALRERPSGAAPDGAAPGHPRGDLRGGARGDAAACALRPLHLAALLALAPTAFLVANLLLPDARGIDPFGYHWGRDFVNFWGAGRLAASGDLAALYDRPAFHAHLRAALTPTQPFMNFSYPPHALLFLWPLGLLPYAAAAVLWTGAGLAAALAVLLASARGAGPGTTAVAPARTGLVLLLLGAPAVVVDLVFVQAGLFLAALLVGGWHLLPRRPVWAGILLGILGVKPHLGLLVPPALILLGAWRALLAAAATGAALVAASLVLFGAAPWLAFVEQALPYQARVAAEPVGLAGAMLVTPFALAWGLGLSGKAAFVAHALVAAGAALAAALVLRGEADARLKGAVLALTALVVTPYSLAYDLAIPALALAAWRAACPAPLGPGTRAALFAFWLAAPTGLVAQIVLGVPATPVAVLALLAALVATALRPPA